MGVLGTGRGRRATMVTAAFGVVLLGSWFVISTATGSTTPHTSRSTNRPGYRGHTIASEATPPPTTTTTTTTTATIPRAAAPGSMPIASSSDVSGTTSAVTPPTTSQPSPPLRPTLRTTGPAQGGSETTGTAAVAVSLFSTIGLNSNGKYSIPVTANNISLLTRWMANEGGLWANNPLNTSHGSAAYPHQVTTSGQDTGIPIFPSLSSGIAATAATLLSNPSYERILRLLGSGKASCVSFARAVIRSPWASGHYGHDPVGFCSGRIAPVRPGHRRHHAG